MKLIADFHTHSKDSRFFHGKNNLEEMAISANEMGLQEVAITDHGFKHLFRTNKDKLKKAREVIDEINSWSKTKVLLGVEADIISEDGTIDIDNETLSYLDILLVGYHRMIHTDFAGYFGGQEKTQESIQKCTNAFINALNKYPITILTHLDSILTTDLYQIGCVCREKGVMVEINNRHTNWSEKQVEDLLASGCMFVISSDAHNREDVGKVDHAFDIVKKYNIPSDLIVNVEFSEEEKSEDDKENDVYFSLYKKRKEEIENKHKILEERKQTEFVNKLSPEMEEALQKIARDKGLNYKQTTDRDVVEDKETVGFELPVNQDDELIRRANEFIQSNSFGEFDAQNSKLENFDENLLSPDESNLESEQEPYDDSQDENVVGETDEKPNEEVKKSFTSNNYGSKKNGFSLNISELEKSESEKQNKSETKEKTTQKSTKNDIAGLVQFALDDKNNESGKNLKTEKKNQKSSEQVKRQKSKFNPLGALSENVSDDNKK